MINVKKCDLYKLSSKKFLVDYLKINDKKYLKQSFVVEEIRPYVKKQPKPRLIETPSVSLKQIQRIIKNDLNKIQVPNNVFSGVKGRSYVDNASFHKDNRYMFK